MSKFIKIFILAGILLFQISCASTKGAQDLKEKVEKKKTKKIKKKKGHKDHDHINPRLEN